MTSPSYLSRGTGLAGTLSAGITLIPPFTTQELLPGDLLIAQFASANETIPSVTGTWTELPGSPVGVGTAGSTLASRVTLYYKWFSPEDVVTGCHCGDAGNHYAGHIAAFRGVDKTDPFDSTSLVSSTVAGATTAVTLPSITTQTDGALVVYFVNGDVDTGSDISGGAWTHGGLSSFTKGANWSTASGNGSNVMYAYGVDDSAGAIGTGSATLSSAAVQAIAAIVLKPDQGSYTPDPVRVAQVALEVVRSAGQAPVRVAQVALEVVRLTGSGSSSSSSEIAPTVRPFTFCAT